jgi:hypothetical protein
MESIALICHPSTPCEPIRRFLVRARKSPGAMLSLEYLIEGDISGLSIPIPRPSRRTDGLWRYTCFEAFLAEGGRKGYYEFNFAPSTEWAAYRFEGYREGMSAVAIPEPPRIVLRRDAQRLELAAHIDLKNLPAAIEGASPVLALSAVVETGTGALSYWALAHPPGKPDFHHPDGFALRLDQPAITQAQETRPH